MKRLASTTFVNRNSSETRFSNLDQDIVLFKELSIDRLIDGTTSFVLPYEHVVSSTFTSGLKEEKKVPNTYKQRSKQEQLEIVLDFIKEHPARERGSILEFSQKKHINKSQLSRYLKAYDAGQLTATNSSTTQTIERGHPSALMNASQIEKVLHIIKTEQGDDEDISNKRIGEIIYEIIGRQPSTGYVSKFASTYLALNGPKRKKKKVEQSIKTETKIEVKSETN